jgi:Leucine-rich repeat (LRR) protein
VTLRSLSLAQARLPHTFIGHYLAGARSSSRHHMRTSSANTVFVCGCLYVCITALSNLVELDLSHSGVKDEDILALSGAGPALAPSSHTSRTLTTMHGDAATGLTQLQDLSLSRCDITDAGLAALARMCTPP